MFGYQPNQPAYYPPYSPPVPDQLAQLRNNQFQPPPPQQGNGMLWVSNEAEAYRYPIAANSAVALWDNNSPTIYLKQADPSGRASLKIFDLVERTAPPVPQQTAPESIARAEWEDVLRRLEDLEGKLAPPKPPKKTTKEDAE